MFAPLYRLHTVNLGKATYSLVHAKIIIQIFDTLNSLLSNGNDTTVCVYRMPSLFFAQGKFDEMSLSP